MISYNSIIIKYLDLKLGSGFRRRTSCLFLFVWYCQKATYSGSLHSFKTHSMFSGSFAFKIHEAWTHSMLLCCKLFGEKGVSSTWIRSLISAPIPEGNSIAFFFSLSCLLLGFRYFFLFCLLCLPMYWYCRKNKWFIVIYSFWDFRQMIHVIVDKNALQCHRLMTVVALWKQEKAL